MFFFNRFAANGGAVPPFLAEEIVLHAAQLADTCGSAGQLKDEAPLIQLLERCSAALAADVAALAAPSEPVAAAAAAAVDATAKGAAAPQCSTTSAQQRATQAGASERAAARAMPARD